MSLLSEQLLLPRNHKEGLKTSDVFPIIFDLRAQAGQIAGFSGAPVLNNLTATTNPTALNDASQGYSTSSIWFNTLTQTFWACTSAIIGNAVWSNQVIGGAGTKNNMTAVSNPGVTDDVNAGYVVNSGWLNTVTGILWFCQNNAAGAAVWYAVPSSSGGLSIVNITAASLKTLVNGGTANPSVVYNVTDAGAATTGVVASLKIMAQSASQLQPSGHGVFKNAKMTTSVLADMGYNVQTNKFTFVYEPLLNNRVDCGFYDNVIAQFRFDNTSNTNNKFWGCSFSFNDLSTDTVFVSCNWETLGVRFNNHTACSFTNHWEKGVNDLNDPELVVDGNSIDFRCNTYWGNDEDFTIDGMGDHSLITYINQSWTSVIHCNGHAVTLRYIEVGQDCDIEIGADLTLYQMEIGEGANVTFKGNSGQSSISGGNIAGITANNCVLKDITQSTAINLTYNSSRLQNCTIQSQGVNCQIINGCDLMGVTVNFANHTGCTLTAKVQNGGTITFTADNQTI